MRPKLIKYLDLSVEYSAYVFILCIPVSIAIVSIFGCMAVILFLIKQVIAPDFSSIKSNRTFFLLLLIFFLFMSLSLINSGPLINKSLKALLMKWGRGPLILWMILGTFRDYKRIVKAACVISFSAALIGLSVFSQKFLGFEFLRHKQLHARHVTGPYETQNDLAAFLTCVIAILLCLCLWKWKNIYKRIGFILITIMLLMSSFWTYCRGGWVGLTAGLILIALLVNGKRLSRKTFWSLFWGAYVFIMPLIAIGMSFLKIRGSPGRIILARGAWHMIKEHPLLGKGLGTFMDYCALYTNNPDVDYAHNCFLQIWAESGIFSLIAFILLNGYVLYKTIKVILRMPASLNFYLLIGLSAGLLGYLVHSFFDTHLYSFQSTILFWIVLGLTVATSSKLGQERPV